MPSVQASSSGITDIPARVPIIVMPIARPRSRTNQLEIVTTTAMSTIPMPIARPIP